MLTVAGKCPNRSASIGLNPGYRRDKAVATPGNRLDAAPLRAVPIGEAQSYLATALANRSLIGIQ